MTTSHGGMCHMNSRTNAARASAKSPALIIHAVHIVMVEGGERQSDNGCIHAAATAHFTPALHCRIY